MTPKYGELGSTIKPCRNRRVKAEKISDTDFTDNIALIADTVKEAQMLMHEVERVAATVGLRMNEGKTKSITQNIENPDTKGKSLGNSTIEHVEDFTSRIRYSDNDIRKGKAWGACHILQKLWNSKFRKSIKIRVFTALVESLRKDNCFDKRQFLIIYHQFINYFCTVPILWL